MYAEWNESARQLAEQLRPLHPSFSVDGNYVVAINGADVLTIECRGEGHFTIGHEVPPTRGGWPVQSPTMHRVNVDRARMMAEAEAWAARN
jgi:hypothetical protein